MGAYNNIQNALNTRLSTVSGLPSVAWPNVQFNPVQATSYVRPTFLPANSDLFTIANENLLRGIYQIDIFAQVKKGTAGLILYADAIRDHFNGQMSLTSSGTTTHIQEISMTPPRRVESWWSCSIEINWIAFD